MPRLEAKRPRGAPGVVRAGLVAPDGGNVTPLLDAHDVAAALKCSVRTAREHMLKMVHSYFGKLLRVSEQALTAYRIQQESAPCETPDFSQARAANSSKPGLAELPPRLIPRVATRTG